MAPGAPSPGLRVGGPSTPGSGRASTSAPSPRGRTSRPGPSAPARTPLLSPDPTPLPGGGYLRETPARSLGLGRGREGRERRQAALRGVGVGEPPPPPARAPGPAAGRAGAAAPRGSLRPARSLPGRARLRAGSPGGGRGRLAGAESRSIRDFFSPFSQHTGNNRASGDGARPMGRLEAAARGRAGGRAAGAGRRGAGPARTRVPTRVRRRRGLRARGRPQPGRGGRAGLLSAAAGRRTSVPPRAPCHLGPQLPSVRLGVAASQLCGELVARGRGSPGGLQPQHPTGSGRRGRPRTRASPSPGHLLRRAGHGGGPCLPTPSGPCRPGPLAASTSWPHVSSDG